MSTEESIADLEIRIARLDDLVDVLNTTVYQQQKKIAELETLCTALARRLKELRDTAPEAAPANEPPPHY
ncbi:SlyX family protein [Noviherbaspirillum galbum]|uniref:SlyX family protein n=1 Tax=Noviherbaspirillum galbum TaxID=2709383 RepID=A0A6B3SRS9_9BURK|nr:SlyX family protein [Noviherbaspirillum galbum]NEX63467.1 SlyX family protein [Noviherbaspirillum galbum]